MWASTGKPQANSSWQRSRSEGYSQLLASSGRRKSSWWDWSSNVVSPIFSIVSQAAVASMAPRSAAGGHRLQHRLLATGLAVGFQVA